MLSEWKFCPNCAEKIVLKAETSSKAENEPETPAVTENAAATAERAATPGMAWYWLWTHIILPLNSLGLLAMSFSGPYVWVISIPLAIGVFGVAYGLHEKRRWAWRANWVFVVTYSFSGLGRLITGTASSQSESETELTIGLATRLILGALLFLAQYVYWRKRKHLFTTPSIENGFETNRPHLFGSGDNLSATGR